jgi:hypothetical protein
VFLNSCHSAAHLDAIVADLVPFAIGMGNEIADGAAIAYAAQFYAAVANGQSIRSADRLARVNLKMSGLSGADLPVLACAANVDPEQAVLVRPGVEPLALHLGG